MVLTNFECWAHGEADAVNFETGPPAARNSSVVDPFNARVVSHIASASNGYYGYAIVNNNNNNNNDAAAADNNNNNCSNNNVQAMQTQGCDADVDADADAVVAARCKKRCFAMGQEQLDMDMDSLKAVKRCRFDDADLVAQYCNDFFSLPATQMIGTQACLMDYDNDMQQPQQQQQQQQQLLQQQQQLQQEQQQHLRIHQHYQDGPQHEQQQQQRQQKLSNALESINDILLDDKCESKFTAEAADLYIATHGGCRHHFKPLPLCRHAEADEEFDI